MTRPLLVLLLAIASSPSVSGQEAKTLPAVKRILDKATAEVKKNHQAFETANQKPLGDARVELQDLSTKLIQDGKNVDARAVIKQIETLETDVLKRANAPAPIDGGGGVQPQRPLLQRMAGRWERTQHGEYLIVNADGTVVLNLDADNRPVVAGRCVMKAPDVIEATWGNGFRWEMRMAGDDTIAVYEWNPDGSRYGQGIALERIK